MHIPVFFCHLNYKYAIITVIAVISRNLIHMTPEQIAEIVRHIRKESGLTQQQLAELAGVGKTVVFDIEKGKPTVQLNSLLSVLNILNIQLKLESTLLNREEN